MDDRAVPRLSPTVLLVDDEAAIRSLLARRLAMTGGATDTALRHMGESNMQCLRKPFTDAELA